MGHLVMVAGVTGLGQSALKMPKIKTASNPIPPSALIHANESGKSPTATTSSARESGIANGEATGGWQAEVDECLTRSGPIFQFRERSDKKNSAEYNSGE